MRIDRIPKLENPSFTDKVIGELQDKLALKLSWLTHSFGKAQKLVTVKDQSNTPFYYPAVHIGDGSYESVLPDQEFGNFSFVVLEDPQIINFNANAFNNIVSRYSLIFWFNLDSIFPGSKDRNLENLKEQIVEILTRNLHLTLGKITIEKIYEQAENIYKGYSLKELDTQYLTQPYGGLRFEGELKFIEGTC